MLTVKNLISLPNRIPLEAFVLILFPCIGLAFAFLFFPNPFSLGVLLFYLFYCNKFFVWIFVFLYVYFLFKIIFALIRLLSFKSSNRQFLRQLIGVIAEQAYFNIIMFFSSLFMGILLKHLPTSVSVEKIAWGSNLVLGLDHAIFGKDLLFWTSHAMNAWGSTSISWLLLQAYNILPLVVTLLAFILFLKNKTLARKFLVFFFLITIISVPLWHFLPTLNPIGFYLANKLDLTPPARITEALKSYQPDAVLSEYHVTFSADYKQSDILDISAFPSLHAGYSIGVILYAFLLWRRSLALTLTWFLLEMAGAVYLGQHYLLDLVYGSAVGLAAYFLVEALFLLEKKYYIGKGSLFIINTMQSDFRKVLTFAKGFLHNVKSRTALTYLGKSFSKGGQQ